MKETNNKVLSHLGIGAFAYLSINKFCGLIEHIIQNILIITQTTSRTVLWLPEVIDLIMFVLLIIISINEAYRLIKLNSRKILLIFIGIFFGVTVLQILFSFFISSYLMENYTEEFNLYYDATRESYELQGYVAFVPIIKFILFAIIISLKKTVTNNGYHTSGQSKN